MGEKKTTPVTINGTEYNYEDLTEQQQAAFNHVIDLDRKLTSARFNVYHLQVGRDAFMQMLTLSLENADKTEEAPAEEASVQ